MSEYFYNTSSLCHPNNIFLFDVLKKNTKPFTEQKITLDHQHQMMTQSSFSAPWLWILILARKVISNVKGNKFESSCVACFSISSFIVLHFPPFFSNLASSVSISTINYSTINPEYLSLPLTRFRSSFLFFLEYHSIFLYILFHYIDIVLCTTHLLFIFHSLMWIRIFIVVIALRQLYVRLYLFPSMQYSVLVICRM